MALHRPSFLAVVLLLASLDLWCSSSSPPCPKSCTCQRASLLNCSFSDLSSVPQFIQDSITELDLSHNLLSSATFDQPHPSLKSLWLGNNSIPYLSLCIERHVRGRHRRLQSETGSGSGCQTWAPTLQLLSAERNLLEQLPEGLDTIKSLQFLQLSFNRISNLKPGILSDLHQLQELHLQHNFITHLHPKLFHNLDQLKVLDLSYNMLTNMQQLTYLTLRNIGADVKLSGNRWRCDCNARNLKRQMTYDTTRGLQAWNIICAFPSIVSGKDLLQLNEEDLKCLSSENKPNLHQDLTVYSGAEVLLFCSAQESAWWTPSGLASVDQHEARLHIREFSEGDAGLYVCVSEEDQVLSVFNLQISETSKARKVRSLPRAQNTSSETAKTFTPGDLALGVCLSILFTFLLAFILGVLARPCIDRLWRRVSKKEARHETHTATSVQRGQYENHAFSNAEEREVEHHRERRVTFSSVEFTEESNVQYYDTVAHGNQESFRSSELSEYQEEVDMHKYRKDKLSDDSSSAEMAAERLRNMKFEHIPDPDELEERRSRSSSSSSNSSQNASEADQRTRDHTKPKSLQLVEESLKRADFSKTTKTKTPLNRSSSPQTNKTHQASSEDSQGDEEQFEFSDVAQSPSSIIGSVPVSFSSNVHQVKNSYDSKRPEETQDNSLSSDSSYSNKDATQTKIKQRTDKKRRKFALKSKPATHSSSSDSESGENISYVNVKSRTNTQKHSFQKSTTQVYNSDGTWPAVDLEHIPSLKRRLDIKALLKSSGSSSSSDSEYKIRGHMIKQKQEAMSELPVKVSPKVSSERESHWPPPDLKKTPFQKPLDTMTPSTDSNSSSASDSDDERKYHMTKQKENELPILNVLAHGSKASQKQAKHWPELDFGKVTRIKRRLDVKAPRAESESSSSSDSEDETRGYVMKQHEIVMSKLTAKDSPTMRPKPENRWPPPDLAKTEFKKPLDTKAPLTDSDSSSASDSDYETKYHMIKQKQEELPILNVSANRSTASQNPDNQWPALDFGKVLKIKRRLDIKAPRAHSDSSSSSDSEDETRQYVKTQKQAELVMSKLPTKVSPSMRPKPENHWPPPDLAKTELKKRLDIKAPSTDSDSSSTSDSDDETKHHITKQKKEELPILNVLANRSTESQKQANHWPALDFEKVTKIKRRLDIKAPRAHSDLSSSSDSEDETRRYVMTKKQEELVMSKLPTKVSPTMRPKPENRWPPPDLTKIELKKPLDTKAPLTDSDSSSASDSDDETKYHMIKQKQEDLPILNVSANRSTASQNPENQWPALDFGKVTKIKRRLDIKAPRAHSDSSSSSDSEDETRQYVKTQKQEELVMSKLPTKVSPTMRPKPENRWPPPDLAKTELKKPLYTKAPLKDSDSSSASDSDDETKYHMTKQMQEELPILNVLANRSTASQKQANHWPALDFGKVTKIKRRLDIKAPREHSDSSSSSDSEDETRQYVKTQKQDELVMSKLPTKVSPSMRPKPENHWPYPDLAKTELKKPLDTKASLKDSDSSSASDSDDETKYHMTKQKQEELPIINVLANRSTASQKQANHWPALDFGKVTKIKKRLDIKAPRAHSDSSSSSDSEDETRQHVKTQKQDELVMSKLPMKVSPSMTPKPENHWPYPDLAKRELKKPLDIKAPSTDSDSSSASDSDDETKYHMTYQKQEQLPILNLLANRSTASQKQANHWPTLDFGKVTKIKRRLDIKAPRAHSDSSSSSDSEDETRRYVMTQKQEELVMSKIPTKVSTTMRPKPENRWPPPDLAKTELKTPLDIKAPTTDCDSSSASDSADETKYHMTKQKQEELPILNVLANRSTASQKQANHWPALDFGKVTKIKRRLDIKAPRAHSDSSSSSHSEDKTRRYVMTQKQEELVISKIPTKVSTTMRPKPENRWPPPDLAKTELKKPLDIKAPTTDSDSSSASDSADETKYHMTKQKQEELPILNVLANRSTASQKQANHWPALDFGKVTKIKRRLDIKAPRAHSDSSSSSDSEDETRGYVMTQKQEELVMSKLPTKVSPTMRPKPENRWPPPDLKIKELKKPLDTKAPLTDSDSSSASDSDDEKKYHMTKQKQVEPNIVNVSANRSTASQNPENQWPALDFGKVTKIKRRLDIKASRAESDSSSSSDIEDETRRYVMREKQEELVMSKLPTKVSPTMRPKPENRWPPPDLTKIELKKPLDTKAPLTDSDSSSASDSDDETKYHMIKQKQEDLPILNVSANRSTASQNPENQWPALDFGKVTKIKRRLDIKAPRAHSDSSSSSDSEDETRQYVKTQKQEELVMSKLPTKVSPTMRPKPENRWPPPDLAKTELKKPLYTKAPLKDSDSSSASDSDDETKYHMTKQMQEELPILNVLANRSTASQKQANHWPALDFGKVTKIKRRLDIKAPREHSDSSSSSDSEDETRQYVKTQKQDELVMSKLPTKVSPSMRPKPENHWPYPDLAKTELKKPLDTKASLKDSDSSSASDSDDETKYHMTKQKQEELPIINVLANRSTASQKQANHWPALDFGKVTKIKKRLDIKAPRAHSDSSSSSDSEDETRQHVKTQKQDELVMSKLPMKVSPSMTPKPENHWPYPDLAKRELKKPLDIKAPSTDSDSSSASDSDDETKYHMTYQKQEQLPILNLLANRSTASQKQANHWPTLDFGKVTKIKRRLDIKAPRAHSDSSSSSDSEDETRRYVMTQKQEELVMSKIPTKVSTTMRPKPENRWPPPDLAKTELKTPLDIKAPTTDCDSSSASDSADETKYHMTKQKQEELPILNVLANRSTASQKQANHWPALDFGKVTKIKRRLDIKAPRAHSDSSSSSHSEDKTRRYVMTQKQEELVISKIPTKVSTTMRPKPENRWPPPDLAKTELKKPLDIKAPTTDSDSSSASDSADETKYHMTKQKQEELPILNVLANRSTASQKQANHWPALDFGKVTKIKRRLDIKAPRAHSDSSSSSDSEDETRGYVMTQKQEELVMSKLPTKVSPTMRPKPENRWPPPDLKIKELKKPLDTKAPLTDSDSSSASDSDDEKKYHMTKQKQVEPNIVNVSANRSTASQNPENQWPALDFGKVTKIKRRLDIKASRAESDSSSSSDIEDETRRYVMREKQEELVMSKLPTKVSPTMRPKPENRWPPPDLTKTEFKKPLDTKAPLTDSDSSSASDSDDETKYQMIKQKQVELPIVNVSTNRSTASRNPENQWPVLDFEKVTKIKRRLHIKAPRAHSDSSSSSDSEDETRRYVKTQKQEELVMSKLPTKVSPTMRPKPENRWPPSDLTKTELKKPLDTKAPLTDSDSSSASDRDDETKYQMIKQKQEQLPIVNVSANRSTASQNPENQWPVLDFAKVTKIKRRLHIKVLGAHSDSSSSSDSEDQTRRYVKTQKQEELVMSKLPTKVSPTMRPKPENRWPPPDLAKTELKKPLDTKAPSTNSDSSSASDSDNETKYHMTKQKQEELPILNVLANRSTASQKQANHWPVLDFGKVAKIKRRLDIKAPRARSDSSSSNDSEDETRGYVLKQKQEEMVMYKFPTKVSPTVRPKPDNRWPPSDLVKTQFKKPLDVKGQSTDSDTSSSSDSETKKHLTEQKQEELPIVNVLANRTTAKQNPENQWPALDLRKITPTKRHLNIKVPTPDPDSSSSIYSENETRGQVMKQKQGELVMSKHATDSSSSSDSDDDRQAHTIKENQEKLHSSRNTFKTSQKPSQHQGNQWPSLDLWSVTRFKKRLDIKAPTADSDVSFANGSHKETIDYMTKQNQEESLISKVPVNITTASQKQWPVLDFGKATQIRPRLDIKTPKTQSESSSSDSEDETRSHMMKQKQELVMSNLPTKVSPTIIPEPENRWPPPDLEKNTEFNKPVDIKATSTDSDSSSSSDSETKHHMAPPKQEELHFSQNLLKTNQASQHQGNQWPSLDLWKVTRFKKRLDIKAPAADLDSSASDSKNETNGHMTKQSQKEFPISKVPVSITSAIQQPANRGPVMDPGKITIKRQLDIKPALAYSDASSNSDSEDDLRSHETKQKRENVLSIQASPTVHSKPEKLGPPPDLGKTTEHRRTSDIKRPSSDSDSSSSSDSGDDKEDHIKQKQEEIHISRNPLKTSQTPSQKLENQWPSLDLWRVTRFKKRLDIKAPTAQLDSSSASYSANETKEIRKPVLFNPPHLSFQDTTTKGFDPDGQWPAINIFNLPRIKRRLDIKAPSPNSGSSSSSDSESETKGHVIKQKQEELLTSKPPPEVPLTVSSKPENTWPVLDLSQTSRIKKHLDVKAYVPPLPSSGSIKSVGLTADPSLKSDRDRRHEGVNQSFNRHVDSKTPSLLLPMGSNRSSSLGLNKSESQSSSSESDEDKTNNKAKFGNDISFISAVSEKKTIRPQTIPWKNMSYSPKPDRKITLEKYTVISDDRKNMPTSDNSRATVEIDPELQLRWATMNLGVSRFRKHLEITSTEASDPKSPPPPDSPISTSSESGSGRRQRIKKRVGRIQEIMHRGASPVQETYQVNPSPPLKETNDRFTFSDVIQQRINEKHSFNENKDLTTPSKETSESSSSSEDETKVHSITDLGSGIPRIKRRLDIKAPSPELGNTPPFFSQNENLTKQNTLQNRQVSTTVGPTEESIISYKRSIFKSSVPKSSFTSGESQIFDLRSNLSQDGSNDIDRSLTPKAASNTSFEDIIQMKLRQSRPKTERDMSASLSSNILGNSPQKTNETLTVSLGAKGRKGLSALKAMSHERRHWEALDKDSGPLFDTQDGGPYSQSHSEKYTDVFSQQSQINSPSASETKKDLDLLLLYGVPRYQSHSIGESSTDILLPDPAKPKPDD